MSCTRVFSHQILNSLFIIKLKEIAKKHKSNTPAETSEDNSVTMQVCGCGKLFYILRKLKLKYFTRTKCKFPTPAQNYFFLNKKYIKIEMQIRKNK